MPKFKVTAVMRTYLETEIKAKDLDEAQTMALDGELDGADFTEQEWGQEWETFWADIEEIKQ